MKLTNEDIAEFQQVWKEVFDEEITPQYAAERGSQLLDLYVLMAKLTVDLPATDQCPPAPDASEQPL